MKSLADYSPFSEYRIYTSLRTKRLSHRTHCCTYHHKRPPNFGSRCDLLHMWSRCVSRANHDPQKKEKPKVGHSNVYLLDDVLSDRSEMPNLRNWFKVEPPNRITRVAKPKSWPRSGRCKFAKNCIISWRGVYCIFSVGISQKKALHVTHHIIAYDSGVNIHALILWDTKNTCMMQNCLLGELKRVD